VLVDELMPPPGFCGVWTDERRELDRRETSRRLERLLRAHIRSPAKGEAWCSEFARLRRLVEAWQ
jgi:hypothetical protein